MENLLLYARYGAGFPIEDRLQVALGLYNQDVADKVLVSGDHGQADYDEVNAMRMFLERNHVEQLICLQNMQTKLFKYRI